MADWEYRGSSVHTILIPAYQKRAERSLLFSGERRTYCTCLLLQIKRGGASFFEIGVSFIFQRAADDSYYISKYHFEIP